MKQRAIAIFLILAACVAVFSAEKTAETPLERRLAVIQYGLDSEIVEVIDALEQENGEEPDAELIDALTGLFGRTRSTVIRDRILLYYRTLENPVLQDFALTVLEDPYDVRRSTVDAVFQYVRALKLKEAEPLLIQLVERGSSEYLQSAIEALGDTGGADAALFLAEYLGREDPELPVKQALVKTLGKLQAVETWDMLAELAQDSDENTFMRMYAAEAIGAMKKDESVPVLRTLIEDPDPNLRVYVLKGLSNYDTPEVRGIIIESFRDSQYKVRLEAAACAKKMKITEAVPYLLYRAKNDPERNVKLACFEALAVFDGKNVTDFFAETFRAKQTAEVFKLKAAEIMIQRDFDTAADVVLPELAEKMKSKNRQDRNYCHALLKQLSQVADNKLHDLCLSLVTSDDIIFKNFGVDIYKKNAGFAFADITPYLKRFAADEKSPSLAQKARRALGDDKPPEPAGAVPENTVPPPAETLP